MSTFICIPANHLNPFLCSRLGLSMSDSVILDDAWRLLKDFSFRRNLSQEYYSNLVDRMVRQVKERRPLEHVDANLPPKKAKHYNDQKALRYNEGQSLPKEFNTRAAKKHKFTLEDIMQFMANDVASQHPELLQAMNMELPASDKKLPNRSPSMHFDAFQTSRPKGQNSIVTPHFDTNPRNGKLQLVTVGDGMLHDKTRQSIHARPTTSPVPTDTHNNANIHESLPQRFNFGERADPLPPAPPTITDNMEPRDQYAGFPPNLAEQLRQQDANKEKGDDDDENKSEPMDIALRLLKNDDERRKIEDYFKEKKWGGEVDETARDYYFTMGWPLTPFNRMSDRQVKLYSQIIFNHGTDGQPNVPSYWREPFQEAGHEYATEILMGDGMEHIPDDAYDELIRYHQHYNDAVEALPGGPNPKFESPEFYAHGDLFSPQPGDPPSPLTHPHDTAQQKMEDDNPHWGLSDDTEGSFQEHYGIYHEDRQFTPQMDDESWRDNIETGEPMDIAMQLLKNFVLEPDNPEQAYFSSSMGYHPETGEVGYVPNSEVDPLNDVKINLASPKQYLQTDRDGNPVDDGYGFDQFVDRLNTDMTHEQTHGAIDKDILQAYLDKILPSENVFSAHEVGAIAAQNPGEGFANQRGADRVSESETKHHPSTRDWQAEQSPFADGRWSPQPAYSSNSEEGWE